MALMSFSRISRLGIALPLAFSESSKRCAASHALVPFAPGSNYILTAEDIRRHPVEFYIKLYNYLTWAVYPGEAQVIERGLYTIFR